MSRLSVIAHILVFGIGQFAFSGSVNKSYIVGSDPRFDAAANPIASLYTNTSLDIRNFPIPGKRPTIRDTQGRIIAEDIMQKRLAILLTGGSAESIEKTFLADLAIVVNFLGRSVSAPSKLNFKDRAGTPIIFPQVLSEEDLKILDGLWIPRAGLVDIPIRTYPKGEALTHAVGWATQRISVAEGALFNASVGQSALEFLLEPQLKPKSGTFRVIRDAKDLSLKTTTEVLPTVGNDLRVTIDADLQERLHEGLRNIVTQGVVLISCINNGALRSMLSYPTFDPARVSPYMREPVYNELTAAPGMPLTNRIFRRYQVRERLSENCDKQGCTPLQILEHFQSVNSGPAIHYTETDGKEELLSSGSNTMLPGVQFNTKVSRLDAKGEGQVVVSAMSGGKYNVLVLIEGAEVENHMEAALSLIATELNRPLLATGKTE